MVHGDLLGLLGDPKPVMRLFACTCGNEQFSEKAKLTCPQCHKRMTPVQPPARAGSRDRK
jgi:hypothetical protein